MKKSSPMLLFSHHLLYISKIITIFALSKQKTKTMKEYIGIILCVGYFFMIHGCMKLEKTTEVEKPKTYWLDMSNKDMSHIQISQSGVDFIKQTELCVLKRYKDNYGYSIGYGHLIKKGENIGETITKERADELFRQDLERDVMPAVRRICKTLHFVPTQSIVDGLASLVYNCGEKGFMKSEVYEKLLRCRPINENGDVDEKDLNFTLSKMKTCRIPSKASGCQESVLNRREAEKKLMQSK